MKIPGPVYLEPKYEGEAKIQEKKERQTLRLGGELEPKESKGGRGKMGLKQCSVCFSESIDSHASFPLSDVLYGD